MRGEIESLRTSCIETLGRKVDNLDFDRLNSEVHKKLGPDSVIQLINESKSDLYKYISETKEELHNGRKKYEESLYERASRAEIRVEKVNEDLESFRRALDGVTKQVRVLEQENLEYVKGVFEGVRKELRQEANRLDSEIKSFRMDLTTRIDHSLLTAEFEKYKVVIESELKEKVDVDEVQRAITGCQNDTINRINAAKKEVVASLEEFSSSITPILEEKLDPEKLENRLSYMISKDEFHSALEEFAQSRDTERISEQITDIYNLIDQKTEHREFLKEKEKMNLILDSLENDLASKINADEVKDMINQKCNIDDVNKALTVVHDELDTKANSEDYESHVKTQTEINQALCAEN